MCTASPARRRQDLVTAEELYELPDDGSRHELLRDLAIEVLSPGDVVPGFSVGLGEIFGD